MSRLGLVAVVAAMAVTVGCKKKKRVRPSNDVLLAKDTERSDEGAAKMGAKDGRVSTKRGGEQRKAVEAHLKPEATGGAERHEDSDVREATDRPKIGAASNSPGVRPKDAVPPTQDIRLLLTMADIKEIAGDKVRFVRRNLPGVINSKETEALMFAPEKGDAFGFAIQVYYEKPGPRARQRFDNLFATYPNAVEIAPVAGRTFFAYFGEVIHVGFLHPMTGKIVVLSCGQKFCNSDQLYELAKKVASRVR